MDRLARYRVVHETRYDYSGTVLSGHQLAHLEPRDTSWQVVRAHTIDIDPEPRECWVGHDYFGNAVLRFFVDQAHDALTVRAESRIDVSPRAPDPAAGSPAWEAATAAVIGAPVDLEVEQYRVPSPMAPLLAASADYARSSFPAGRPWLDGVLELTRRIRTEFTYDPKATTVTTRVGEVLAHRRGVCQDFAHLMISCLRSLGMAARYESGYVLNRPAPGQAALTGADASHAWVGAHCPGFGWVGFDPTNGKFADLEFITLGWGREFSDVTPLRGVVFGAASQELAVAVSVEPLPGESPEPGAD